MANLKEVRLRITSVSSTQQITKAMKMVSAAKLRRAQDAVTQMRPYASKLREILENVSSTLEGSAGGAFSKQRAEKNVLLVVITSNRGLCGAFNANVIKTANKLIKEEYKGSKVSVFCIGKKGADFFRKSTVPVLDGDKAANLNAVYDKLNFATVAPHAERIMKAFENAEFDKVVLIYNQFKNAAVQILTTENYLPVLKAKATTAVKKGSSADYIFEPNKETIVENLIPKSLKTQLYKALLDSHAAEHGARMTAMHKATDNAGDLIKELKLMYNKARQAAITNEILEIVGGAEALEG
ncbi:MAG TPA: ATP synthase F1 subunit gamma [Bacteroidia bacterium]|nr:ATP synthase F1 subunit gamma [Bacteroidia bacterium]HRH06961.1 ATP synthase F1 subunit gamma [Bacteroidia bacterium]HRH62196.1 ATP synthase F1 subunit gamma [Bacteroidia bacterium]